MIISRHAATPTGCYAADTLYYAVAASMPFSFTLIDIFRC